MHSLDTINQLIQLRAEGKSFRRIAAELNVSDASARRSRAGLRPEELVQHDPSVQLDGRARRMAADAKLGHQLAVGRQLRAELERARCDALGQHLIDPVVGRNQPALHSLALLFFLFSHRRSTRRSALSHSGKRHDIQNQWPRPRHG